MSVVSALRMLTLLRTTSELQTLARSHLKLASSGSRLQDGMNATRW